MSEATFPARPARARPKSPVPMLAATAIGWTLVFALSIAFGVRGWDVAVLGLAVLTGFVGMLPLLVDASRPPEKRQILITAISFFWVMYFALPVFTQYLWVERTVLTTFDIVGFRPQDIVTTQLTCLGGLICMFAGFYLPIGRSVSRMLPRLKSEWSHGNTLLAALVLLAVGWSVLVPGQFGLIPERAGSGFLGTLAALVFNVVSLLTLAFIRYRSLPALVLLLLVVPPTMFLGFFTGSRRAFLLPVAMVALAYLVVERRLRMRFVIGGVALIIVLYPVSNFYREVVQHGLRLKAVQVLKNPGRAYSQISGFLSSRDMGEYLSYGLEATGTRFNLLGVVTTIIHDTPSRVPYQRGWTLGYAFLAYIPRVLWPGKPTISIGQWVTDTYSGVPGLRSHTACTWIGELYFNFGYPCVVIGMVILGIWFRLLQEHFLGPDAAIPALMLGCAVIDALAPGIEGTVNSAFSGVVFLALPIIFIYVVLQVLSPPRRRPLAAGGYRHSSVPADR